MTHRHLYSMALLVLTLCGLFTPLHAAILTKVKTVMPVGDSITLGKDGVTGGYRSVLYDYLTSTGYAITYVGKEDNGDPANATVTSSKMITQSSHEGYGSFRIDMILNGGSAERRTAPPITTTLATYHPDIVLLMIGTNDVIQNWELPTINERLDKLIATILESDTNLTLLVASIPPISPNRPGLEERVVAYNAAIPGLVAKYQAQKRHIAFVDVHAALENGGLSGDGVHPGDSGYQKIAAAWYQALTGETPPTKTPPAKP